MAPTSLSVSSVRCMMLFVGICSCAMLVASAPASAVVAGQPTADFHENYWQYNLPWWLQPPSAASSYRNIGHRVSIPSVSAHWPDGRRLIAIENMQLFSAIGKDRWNGAVRHNRPKWYCGQTRLGEEVAQQSTNWR
ncbi:hypothetical protein CERSUDRAFT_77573 [Gelatoporia subvermispora B]|uniref:Uncharacterized protein n=1 Tax=Ceriporiopsis subvermispora (strain B) TaxID=914234 RepID=M2R084_CERS8|nr:hypothetical protein CERSUDRAFT_77573 [Gelatoporia subvermispora B]